MAGTRRIPRGVRELKFHRPASRHSQASRIPRGVRELKSVFIWPSYDSFRVASRVGCVS